MAVENVQFIVWFDVLYTIGLVLLVVVLSTTFLSAQIHRSSTWNMFLISWALISGSHLLLVGHQTGPSPDYGICLLQTTLIYGLPSMTSLYALAFIIQAFLTIRTARQGRGSLSNLQVLSIHALPVLGSGAAFLVMLVPGLLRPEIVVRDDTGMYCRLSINFPGYITGAIPGTALLLFLVMGHKVTSLIHPKRWDTQSSVSSNISREGITRVVACSACSIVALVVAILECVLTTQAERITMNIFTSMFPIFASIIFGTQRDIIEVWKSWLPRKWLHRPAGSNDLSVSELS